MSKGVIHLPNRCPRGTKCQPLSCLESDKGESFVCVGLHGENKEPVQDKFRHCFKSETTDSIYDYDEYDLKSLLSVVSESLVIDHLNGRKK